MAKGCAKCKETECEECPEWIFTLADLIMCMMGLFVILWVLKPEGQPPQGNTAEATKLVKMTAAIREAFNYVPDPKSLDPVDMELIRQRMEGDNVPRGPGEGGKTTVDNKGAEGEDPLTTSIRPGEMSTVGGALLFDAGSPALSADAARKVRQIADSIRGHRQIVVVKGHTSLDDLDDTATDRDRMDLSIARARAVADVLQREGVAPEVIRIQGCGTFEPTKRRRAGPEGQILNRRVEIEVTGQLVEDRQDRAPTATPGPTLRNPEDRP